MSVRSGFFDSQSHDRIYWAEDMSRYFEGLVSDGVLYNVDDGLEVTAVSGEMSVNVASGRALIDCRWIRNSSDLELEISASSSTYSRIDAVVVKLDLDEREMTIEVVEGTPATTPTAPTLADTDTVKYLRLANISIPAGASTVTVTDNRGASECPWVASVTPSSSIVYYDNAVTSTATTTVNIGIDEYEPSIDMLEVFINGIAVNPDEYTISGIGSNATITFNSELDADNELWFRVVKSLDYQLSQVVDAEEET